MEFNISDLLDDLQEVSVDIRPHTAVSANRIKELTMKKIHKYEEEPKRRGLSAIWKLALAAAIIASLALPVMAATGFHFTDWLVDIFDKGTGYDNDLITGSHSAHWEVSGWIVELSAQDQSAGGATVVCKELGNPVKEAGKLTADESFWLEMWEDGKYEKMPEPAVPIPAGEAQEIPHKETVSWSVDWTESYGNLLPGSYRIGKVFTYTAPSGETQDVTFYAKFRVFSEEMTPYIEQCKAALIDFHEQENWHLTYTVYPENDEGYDHYTEEIWKNGDDYLLDLKYIGYDGSVVGRRGSLLRGGVGYSLTWAGESVLSGIAAWENADYLQPNNFDLWYTFLDIADGRVGEIYADADQISFLMGSVSEKDDPLYWELTFTLDEQDSITKAQLALLPYKDCSSEEKDIYHTIEIHRTSADEIAKAIAAQDVGKPVSFSWQDEQSLDGKTDGFVNTTPRPIADAQDAIAAAKAECTLEYQNTAVVYYDETADMWKVELGHSQDNICQTVYLDSQGITKLIVTK